MPVPLDDDIGQLEGSQGTADGAPDPAEADDHSMVAQGASIPARERRHRQVASGPLDPGAQAGPLSKPGRGRIDSCEDERVERDREQRPGQDQVLAFLRQQPQREAKARQDERELADLGQARRDRQRRPDRVAEGEHDGEGGQRLAEHDHEQHREHGQGLAHQDGRVEQHADRDEEQDRERVLQR
jgi:hypothetical protein